MINIQNKVDCCVCNACADICVKHAISFVTDNEGFWYPKVNKELCVDCGLCDKVCPIQTHPIVSKVAVPDLCTVNESFRVSDGVPSRDCTQKGSNKTLPHTKAPSCAAMVREGHLFICRCVTLGYVAASLRASRSRCYAAVLPRIAPCRVFVP